MEISYVPLTAPCRRISDVAKGRPLLTFHHWPRTNAREIIDESTSIFADVPDLSVSYENRTPVLYLYSSRLTTNPDVRRFRIKREIYFFFRNLPPIPSFYMPNVSWRSRQFNIFRTGPFDCIPSGCGAVS